MGKTIRAKYLNGVIKPLEKIEVAEGKEITVTIIDIPLGPSANKGFEKAAGSWKGTIDAEKLINDIYKDRLISTRRVPKL